jgi:hypothetical protein
MQTSQTGIPKPVRPLQLISSVTLASPLIKQKKKQSSSRVPTPGKLLGGRIIPELRLLWSHLLDAFKARTADRYECCLSTVLRLSLSFLPLHNASRGGGSIPKRPAMEHPQNAGKFQWKTGECGINFVISLSKRRRRTLFVGGFRRIKVVSRWRLAVQPRAADDDRPVARQRPVDNFRRF